VLAADDVSIVNGFTVGVQFGAGGVDGPDCTIAACITTNCLSATAMTPVRSPPSLAATCTSMAPGPLTAVDGTWIHDAVVVARHEQPATVVTLIRLEPPAPPISADAGSRANEQGRAACVTAVRWPFTAIAPDRATIWGFASTLAVKLASPCPEGLLNRIQDTSLLDVQAQSRVVATVTVTLPPSALTACGFAVIDVAQRISDGAEISVTLVDPQASVTHAMAAVASEAMTRGNS
jgi:hypothetical protein